MNTGNTMLYTLGHPLASPPIRATERGGWPHRLDAAFMSTHTGTAETHSIDHAANLDNSFERDAALTVERVQQSLIALLESDGKKILKSRDAQRYFGLDANLSWQIFKLLSGTDLLGIAQYVPPAVSMQKLFAAARERSYREHLVVAAEQAFERFNAFVTLHAGDRARFDSMVTAVSTDDEGQLSDLQHRKSLFKSHSYFWGLELGTMYWATLIGPSVTEPGTYTMMHLRSLLQFNRLRSTADAHVTGLQYAAEPGKEIGLEPLDREAFQRYGAAVIPPFSTKALPLLRTRAEENGGRTTSLAGGAVGLTGSLDVSLGDIVRHVPIEAWSKGENCFKVMYITRPTQHLVMEFLWHRSLPRMQGKVAAYGHLAPPTSGHSAPPPRPEWRIPCRERVHRLSPKDDPAMPEVPRRHELLTYGCERLGWSLDEFDIYRVHIEYPILDTVVIQSLVLPA
jgi:hypothetical protein